MSKMKFRTLMTSVLLLTVCGSAKARDTVGMKSSRTVGNRIIKVLGVEKGRKSLVKEKRMSPACSKIPGEEYNIRQGQ